MTSSALSEPWMDVPGSLTSLCFWLSLSVDGRWSARPFSMCLRGGGDISEAVFVSGCISGIVCATTGFLHICWLLCCILPILSIYPLVR